MSAQTFYVCFIIDPHRRIAVLSRAPRSGGRFNHRTGTDLASLADSHALTTISRRLSALGKMHPFNDLPWNPAHRDHYACGNIGPSKPSCHK
jgi:hypothetical protein